MGEVTTHQLSGQIQELVEIMRESFASLQEYMDKRFDANDKRHDSHDERFDAHDQQFEEIHLRLDRHERKLIEHDDNFQNIKEELVGIHRAIDYLAIRQDKKDVSGHLKRHDKEILDIQIKLEMKPIR